MQGTASHKRSEKTNVNKVGLYIKALKKTIFNFTLGSCVQDFDLWDKGPPGVHYRT
jgi:hypothetical protein